MRLERRDLEFQRQHSCPAIKDMIMVRKDYVAPVCVEVVWLQSESVLAGGSLEKMVVKEDDWE